MKIIQIIMVVNLVHQMIVQGTRMLIPLMGSQLGASSLEIGFMAAAFSVFPLLLAVKAGAWIDRWQPHLPIVIGGGGVAFSLIVPFLFPSIPALYVSQIAIGISQIFVNLALQNTVGMAVQPEQRDRYFGWFSFTSSVGQSLGPLFIGFVAGIHQVGAYLAAFFLSIIPLVLGIFLKTPKRHAENLKNETASAKEGSDPVEIAGKISVWQILKIKGMHQAILSSMLVQLTKDVMTTYFPLFALSKGVSERGIGLIIGFQGLTSMVIRLLQGSIVRRFKRHLVLLYTLFSAGIGFHLIPFYGQIWYYIVLTGFIGLGLGLAQPLSITSVVNLSPPGCSGKALGLRITGNRLAQMTSPIIFGFIAQTFSIIPVFSVCGTILMVGALYSSLGRNVRKSFSN